MKKFLVICAVLALCVSAQAKTKNKSLAEQAKIALENGKQEQAFRMAKKSCQGQNPKGCDLLAYFYTGAGHIKKDDNLAKKYYAQACNGGVASSCVQLGSLALSGQTRDTQTAIKFYKKACALKDKVACQTAKEIEQNEHWKLNQAYIWLAF